MHMPVGQLDEFLPSVEENSFTATLGEFSVSDDATSLRMNTGLTGANYRLDDSATAALAKYLNIPKRYLKSSTLISGPPCPALWLRETPGAPTTIERSTAASWLCTSPPRSCCR